MIEVTTNIAIPDDEVSITFIRASGPGGQNVNKLSTAAQLRFDARNTPSLPAPVRQRLEAIAGTRLTKDGVIVITADRFRTQEANRKDAIGRLVAMIRKALFRPKKRIRTRPPESAKRRRLESKARRGALKKMRRAKISSNDHN